MLRTITTWNRPKRRVHLFLLIFLFCLYPYWFFAQTCNGTSPSKAFTSLGQARNVASPGIYFFNLNGTSFSTYVDVNGFVLVAQDFGDGIGSLVQSTALTSLTRGILTPTVLSKLTSTNKVRLSHSNGVVDATTTNATIINRVVQNTTLHQGINDNGINDFWTGTGSIYLTNDASATTPNGSLLHQNVFHARGNSTTTTWIPKENYQRAVWSSGEIPSSQNLRLWVQADPVNLINICSDTDNDGVTDKMDLDDDNDGVLDAVESPSCYYTFNDVKIVGATTTLSNYNSNAAYSFSELYDYVFDNLASYGVLNTAIANEVVYEFEMDFPVLLTGITEYFNYSSLKNGATFKWQGYSGSTWNDLTDTLTASQATDGSFTYSFTKNNADYSRYRLLGISGQTYYNRIYEFVPESNNFVASAYPKDSCADDTDGDGLYNHQDLDSDGDGCYDVYESSVNGATLNSGGYSDSLIVDPNVNDVGANGSRMD